MMENKAWLTVEKNRYHVGELIAAVLHTEGNFARAIIRAMQTGPDGKEIALEPVRDGRDAYHLYTKADVSGVYTLTCDIDNNEEQHICSTCFFVGDCEAAIPKVPTVPLLFVPEMWEEPDYFKLISFYLMSDGKPVTNETVTLTFRNKNGCLEKEMRTDGTGNVFFAPYMAGTYCLVIKVSVYNVGNGRLKETTAAFSVAMTESAGKRIRVRKRAYRNL